MPFTIAAPIRLGTAQPRPARAAPRLGEHTDEILAEAGYDSREIETLRATGAVA